MYRPTLSLFASTEKHVCSSSIVSGAIGYLLSRAELSCCGETWDYGVIVNLTFMVSIAPIIPPTCFLDFSRHLFDIILVPAEIQNRLGALDLF